MKKTVKHILVLMLAVVLVLVASVPQVTKAASTSNHVHSCKWVVTVQPSCARSGTELYMCTTCGAVTNGRSIQYYGTHNWGRYIVTKAPTRTEPGTAVYKCTNPGCTATRTITIWGN